MYPTTSNTKGLTFNDFKKELDSINSKSTRSFAGILKLNNIIDTNTNIVNLKFPDSTSTGYAITPNGAMNYINKLLPTITDVNHINILSVGILNQVSKPQNILKDLTIRIVWNSAIVEQESMWVILNNAQLISRTITLPVGTLSSVSSITMGQGYSVLFFTRIDSLVLCDVKYVEPTL